MVANHMHWFSFVFICFYTTALTLDAFRLVFYAFDTFDGLLAASCSLGSLANSSGASLNESFHGPFNHEARTTDGSSGVSHNMC